MMQPPGVLHLYCAPTGWVGPHHTGFLLVLYSRQVPASGSLQMLFPLPGRLSPRYQLDSFPYLSDICSTVTYQ